MKLKKKNLVLFTGCIWLLASFILLFRAYSWIDILTDTQLIYAAIIAIVLAIVKVLLIFHKLSIKNIKRIFSHKHNLKIYQFHTSKDQIMIILMIVMGTLLRNSPIHKLYLMPVYLGIGVAMLYSSLLYFKYYLIRNKNILTSE